MAGIASQSDQRPPGRKPNVLIIMADDLDSKQLSCYGGENMQTPHIDGLASSGMRFTNMIASEAMCVPTRASLFTGLFPARHGAYQNHKPVYDGLKSICHYLGDLGYRVGLTGKNHVTKPREIFPFDIVPGFEPNCVSRTDEYFLDSVRQYITQPEPYCLFVMSINPHTPWTVGDPSEFDPDKLVLPVNWADTRLTRQHFAKFLAEVRRLDDQVGDVMKLLEETGQLEHTIVIFLGEQGPQFPGGKWTLWDYGQRSSMIIRWPGVVKPGTVSEALVQYEDVVPTLVDIAGGKAIDNLDGISFAHVLEDGSKGKRQYAFGIHNNIPAGTAYPMRSIRDHDYKFIWNLTPNADYFVRMMTPNGKNLYSTWLNRAQHDPHAAAMVRRLTTRPEFELYDLKTDPDELNNLAHDPSSAALVSRYRSELERWMQQQGDTGAAMDVEFAQPQATPETQAKQRASGLTKRLQLTEEQSDRVFETFLTFFTKMDETQKANLSQAEHRKANQQHVAERERGLKDILTSTQWEKLMEIRKKERGTSQKRSQNNSAE